MADRNLKYITKTLRSSTGATNSRTLYAITDLRQGTTEVVVKVSISKRFRVDGSVEDVVEQALVLYDRFAREYFDLEDLLK